MKQTKIAVLLAASLGLAGCTGPFHLTRKVHSFNQDVGNKWANEAVFLGFLILPVYAGSALLDALVFNSIEFWGGDNPVAKGTKRVENGERAAVLSVEPEKRRVRVDQFAKDRPAGSVILAPEPEGMAARSVDGKVLMRARTGLDGTVQVFDAWGGKIAEYGPEELRKFQRRRG